VLAALPAGAWSEPPPAPPPSTEQAPVQARETVTTAPRAGSPGPVSERTAMAVAIGAGVMALAGLLAWLGRRLLRK
jgi:hypothetical protein